MGKFVVVDQDNFVPSAGQVMPQEDMVERDGYRDTQQVVEEFRLAGMRLDEWRKGEFDYEDEVADPELPVTRRSGFDMAEASMLLESERRRIDALEQVLKKEVSSSISKEKEGVGEGKGEVPTKEGNSSDDGVSKVTPKE